MVLGFPGNKFTGKIAPEPAKLVESQTIRILDLVFIGKNMDGTVVPFEFDQQDEPTPVAAVRAIQRDIVSTGPSGYFPAGSRRGL